MMFESVLYFFYPVLFWTAEQQYLISFPQKVKIVVNMLFDVQFVDQAAYHVCGSRISIKIYMFMLTYESRYDKTNKMSVLPAKTRQAWASAQSDQESLLCAEWVTKDPRFLHGDSED